MSLVELREEGLYCPRADLYIDPWKPVRRAVVTHAHADHARPGHGAYLAHHDSVPVLKHRLGRVIRLEGYPYRDSLRINGVSISLHPAGHIIGSSQVRLEYRGETWVISGDYKLAGDGITPPYEPVKCHHFITESTFGLPVFKWQKQEEVLSQIHSWWQKNKERGIQSVLIAYSLGKAQRLIHSLDRQMGNIFVHGSIEGIHSVLENQFPTLKGTMSATRDFDKKTHKGSMIIAPSSAIGTPWMKRFEPQSLGIVSGWMALRGNRRRRSADRGFVLSDHADWNGLNQAIRETGAEHIYLTHGYILPFQKWLRDQGLHATGLDTMFEGELQDTDSVEE